jgi:hypothetical protein
MLIDALLQHKVTTDPVGNPPSGYLYVYAKTDGIYQKDSAGVITKLTNVASSGSPGGNDKELQYNSAGNFAGAANLEVESGNLALVPTTDPTAVAGRLLIYAKDIGGRYFPKWLGPSGVDTPIQSGMFFNQVSIIQAGGGTTPNVLGCTITSVGTISHPTLTTTNILAQTRRFVNTSTTTAASLASTRINVLECWRGNASGFGGFFVLARFGLVTLQAGMRAFVGLSSTATTAPTNVDPTTTTDAKIGMAINTNTGNWNLIHNTAGTAPTVIALGANFPVNATDMLELVLFAKPNDTVVTYRIRNLQTNLETTGTLSTNLPATTAFLGRLIWATNNATAASVAWACSRFGLETDF